MTISTPVIKAVVTS